MNIFISWSGELSKQVAELLKEWLPNVLQSAKPWISSADIEKGEVWFGALTERLATVNIGVICLTKENMNAPWILFEAGALSKGLSKQYVCTLLIDLEPKDLAPPLSQFNATHCTRSELLKLLKTINSSAPNEGLSEASLEASFSQWWKTFDTKFKKIIAASPKTAHRKREAWDMTAEILQLVRSVHGLLQEQPRRKEVDWRLAAVYDPFSTPIAAGGFVPPPGVAYQTAATLAYINALKHSGIDSTSEAVKATPPEQPSLAVQALLSVQPEGKKTPPTAKGKT